MKTGDVVRLTDGSYSYSFKDGVLEGNTCPAMDRSRRWEIVAVDCKLPTNDKLYTDRAYLIPFNDTIIKDLYNGEVVFTQERFLSSVHKCPKCGREIE